jgi:hypothetical protein
MTSAPLFVHCCHCLRCQRETGSAFVLNALIETERWELSGAAPVAVAVPTDSGNSHRILRCESCGTALASEYGGVEKLRFVRVGTLDDPAALPPDVHIYTRSKLPWIALPPGVPAFEAYYSSRDLWPAESLARRKAVVG